MGSGGHCHPGSCRAKGTRVGSPGTGRAFLGTWRQQDAASGKKCKRICPQISASEEVAGRGSNLLLPLVASGCGKNRPPAEAASARGAQWSSSCRRPGPGGRPWGGGQQTGPFHTGSDGCACLPGRPAARGPQSGAQTRRAIRTLSPLESLRCLWVATPSAMSRHWPPRTGGTLQPGRPAEPALLTLPLSAPRAVHTLSPGPSCRSRIFSLPKPAPAAHPLACSGLPRAQGAEADDRRPCQATGPSVWFWRLRPQACPNTRATPGSSSPHVARPCPLLPPAGFYSVRFLSFRLRPKPVPAKSDFPCDKCCACPSGRPVVSAPHRT